MALIKQALILGATAIAVSGAAAVGWGTYGPTKVPSIIAPIMAQDEPKEVVDEVWNIVQSQYVDATFNQTDWVAVRKDFLGRKYTNRKAAYEASREMLKKLNDPYTRFMDPDEYSNMKIDTTGELSGVGIQLAVDDKTKELTVVAPIEDSPAFRAGIQAKDVIIKIDNESTKGMDDKRAVQLIRGEVGSQVTLTVRRDKKELAFPITRDRIEIHPVKYRVQKAKGQNVGYIRLVQFSQPAIGEMEDAIRDLEKQDIQGYVLDLRSNPGGLLNASIDIARMFMDKGTIVSTVTRRGDQARKTANNSALTRKPMVVLVDGGSASASEILSGALQDNSRSKVIGTKTFGKGLVQAVLPLRSDNEQSAMAVTIAKYLTPSGRDINKLGIEPDVKVELTEQQRKSLSQDNKKIGTPADAQFAKAVQVLLSEKG
ncbi:PDZ domain-containing protein [filamentous cyanobacterium LEGE 11480]|uniref:PDZ domain-containing protein n=1 Tax=Romeriopsis navalis LEGE 11480 TaxID=2777977 RepID=A0A928Z4G0_9CYAN|nr:S41 family peptidase [Romeriopsis navalis]MBE9030992.1 PDZ domain-containing protein [Romeriopsis navalis LEGE 11480]